MKSTNIVKYKIGIFGSAEVNGKKSIQKARELAEILTLYPIVLITGAGWDVSSLPGEVAYRTAQKGVEVWGFSPSPDFAGHKKLYPKEKIKYKKIIYIPKDYKFINNPDVCRKYRNVTSTATCDGGIIISGRWGTLNEFTNLIDMGKVIGVLTGAGGIADEISKLSKKIRKENKSKLIFSSSPKELVEKVILELKNRR